MEKEEKEKSFSALVSFYVAILMVEFGALAWVFSLFAVESISLSSNVAEIIRFSGFSMIIIGMIYIAYSAIIKLYTKTKEVPRVPFYEENN